VKVLSESDMGKINLMQRRIYWQIQTLSLRGSSNIARNGMQASAYSMSAFQKPFIGFAEIRYEGLPPNHMRGNFDFMT
jgi:hypothetical protein